MYQRGPDRRDVTEPSVEKTQKWSHHARWASTTNALLGAWLIASPWLLDAQPERQTGMWPPIIVGAGICIFATARSLWPTDGVSLSMANACFGLGLIICPWAFDSVSDSVGFWGEGMVGLTVSILAAWSLCATLAFRASHYPADGPD